MLINDNPKNILYIGPYRQWDGWGLAARDYLRALLTTHHNIKAQPIYLAYASGYDDIEASLKKAENNNFDHYDIVIQHCLPMVMTKTKYYDIGLLFIENQNFTSESVVKLNMMNEIWVSSHIEKNSLISGGVTSPIHVIGHPIRQNVSGQKNNIFEDIIADFYKFYFIGEHIQRKNILDLVKAFHLEFDTSEKVSLVIKTSINKSPDANANMNLISKEITDLKKRLRIGKQFHQEIIITHRLTDEQISTLHKNCDCFVLPSLGEAFCRPAAEALMHGNYLISTSNIGLLDHVNETDRCVVDCYPTPVIVDNPDSFGSLDFYNGNEMWYAPNIKDLREKMRYAFENKKHCYDPSIYNERFSYSNIGKNICTRIKSVI